MAFTKPTKLPEWASGDAASVVEPLSGEKSLGWVAGQTPPAPYMNWLMGGDFGYFPWLQYVSTFEQQALTWPEAQTFTSGFVSDGDALFNSSVAMNGGLVVTGGLANTGAITTDTLTASGALTGASLSVGSGSITGGTANLAEANVSGVTTSGTLKTANLAPAVLSGTVQVLGTIAADLQVAAPTGTFSGTVTAGLFSGPQNIEARHVVSSFLNGWSSAGAGVWYYKDNANRLWLYVSAGGGTVGIATPIFQLPVGWRPTIGGQEIVTQRWFDNTATQTMQLYVAANGEVSVYGGGFTNGAAMPAPGFIANGSIWLGA